MSVPQLSWREMRMHPGRTILTLLSVVVGVAAIVAVSMATKATKQAYAELYETLTGRADLQVVAGLGGGFDQTLYIPIEKIAGVATPVPVIQRMTILYFGGQRTQSLAMAIDPKNKESTQDYRIIEGELFGKTPGVVLEQAFASQLGVKVGDEVKLLVRRGMTSVPIVGIVEPQGGAGLSQGLVLMPIPLAQYLFRMPKQLDAIYLHLEEDADVSRVQQAIAELLPNGVRVEPPPSRSKLADQSLMAMYQGLNLASSLSMVVAAFIIMNTFLMTVAQRQKQLAILRAIGATRKQVLYMVLREGCWLGILGSLLGVGLGIVGAMVLTRLIGRLFGTGIPQPEFTIVIGLIAFLAGLGVALLASYLPARQAAKISPLSGMKDIISGDDSKPRRRGPIWGAVLLLISSVTIIIAASGLMPFWASIPGVLALLVSLVMILPIGLNPAVNFVGKCLYPLFGFPGELAQRQLLRRRSRSILTMGVLFVATATGIGTGVTVLNDSQDVDRWFERAVGGDFFVRAMMLDLATGQSADLPPEVGEEIKAIRGIAKVRSARLVSTKSQDEQVVVMARDFLPDEPLYLDLRRGDEATVRKQMNDGAVVIGTVLSQRLGLEVGDTIELNSEKGLQQLPIVGVASDYSAAGMIVYMERVAAERLLGINGVDVYIVVAKPEELPNVETALTALCKKHGLLLQSFAELQKFVQGIKNGIVGSLWGLLTLGFIVASFGIANTLAMNVLEQTREIGLLRMIAMTRQQVRRMILAQAIIMGILGLAPGVVAGLIMAITSNRATQAAFGQASEFHWHVGLLIAVVVTAGFVITLAAWIPATRAARLPPAAAIRYE